MTFMKTCGWITAACVIAFAAALIFDWESSKLPFGVTTALMVWIMATEAQSRERSRRFYAKHPENSPYKREDDYR
jgi:hypothetical protein